MTAPKGESKEVTAERRRADYAANREKKIANAKRWRQSPSGLAYLERTAEKRKQSARDRYAANKEERDRQINRWKRENRTKVLGYLRKSTAKSLSTESGKIHNRIKSRLWRALRGTKAGAPTVEVLGYSTDELRAHLERQFAKGMGWHNMSEWHIDHIVPLSSFNFTGPDDPGVRRAWALTNLRPLWAAENQAKSSKRDFLL
jgi:hypothetical protein